MTEFIDQSSLQEKQADALTVGVSCPQHELNEGSVCIGFSSLSAQSYLGSIRSTSVVAKSAKLGSFA